MRNQIAYWLLFFIFCPSYAQTPLADSLQLLLPQATSDTARLRLLNAIVIQIYQSDIPKTIEYSTEALAIAERLGDVEKEMQAHYFIGVGQLLSSNEPTAIEHVEKALEIAEKIPDGQQDRMDCLNLLGNIYRELNDIEKALHHFFESAKIAEENDILDRLATSYNNIGKIYLENDDLTKAKSYFSDALAILIAEEDFFFAAFVYNNLSEVTESPDSSILLLNKALEIFEKETYLDGIAHSSLNIAIQYELLLQFEKALPYLEKARTIFESEALNFKPGLVNVYLHLGTVTGELGDMGKAEEWFEKSIGLAKEITDNYSLKDVYEKYSDLLASKNRHQEALHFFKLASEVKDSLFNESKANELAESETKYQTELKEKEISQKGLELEIQTRQKNRILLAGIILTLLLTGIFLYFRYRQKLKQQQAELDVKLEKAEANKLREMDKVKSNFFANISHEFRTPLTLILGPLKQMREGSFKGNAQKYQDMMIRNGERLMKLVNQLLDLSKLESGKMKLNLEQADIVTTVRAMAFSFESLAERKEIDFEVIVPDLSVPAAYDKDKLEKILSNLLSNAFKYTDEKGTVSIELTIIATDKTSSENEAEISIKDTGQGIPSGQLPHIFERFFQTSNTSDLQVGSGIGLALTKELVELHKGTIEVQSEWEAGTIVTVRIPIGKTGLEAGILKKEKKMLLNSGEGLAHYIQSDELLKADKSAPLLLLVEDNEDVRMYVKNQLELEYRIIESANGAEGLDRAIETIPDLIISDVMMPKMNGIDMCKSLKTNDKTSHIPIIMLTAKAERADKIEGLQTGADDYLMKPFDAEELTIRIQNLIEQRRRLQKSIGQDVNFHPEAVQINSVDENFLSRVKQSIEENLDNETFSVVELSSAMNMSRSQLHRKLKALTNQSPNQIIRGMRLLRAKELLKKKAGNASEVAFMVGFSSLAYFSTCYRDKFGVSPSEV